MVASDIIVESLAVEQVFRFLLSLLLSESAEGATARLTPVREQATQHHGQQDNEACGQSCNQGGPVNLSTVAIGCVGEGGDLRGESGEYSITGRRYGRKLF